ncbi:sterile alpha motif domain-containing protein 9-like [Odontesthes bonariensis]|uniref:sterile alpha motif domain-containing protein 9-like n=1 Tax=Odontesthes bonariensis TaxID=219752 RepID=UPI003F58D70A
MSQSVIETWTTEEVHQWLMTQVRVHPDSADRFTEEEVSGESLVSFEKTDVLDLGIKHGPAVKIMCYLKTMKEGSKHQSEFPAYVETWTKEQVGLWLQQHAKVYSKYAERFLEENVSGDCLVCFKKQDLLDLGVKSGPAVKILAQLRQMNTKPEPLLELDAQTSADQRDDPEPAQPEQSVAQTSLMKQQAEPKRDETTRSRDKRDQLPFCPSEEEDRKPSAQHNIKKKETVVTTTAPETSDITVKIEETLGQLLKEDLKRFKFFLRNYEKSKIKPFNRSELEEKDIMETATLLTDRYGKEALQVTIETLKSSHFQDLACQLEKYSHQRDQLCHSREVTKKEANQGHKLKNLLTCGGNSLDNYDRFVVVVNKSSSEQVQYLQFLSKLELFCVLDFDPDSAGSGGLCHSYRELRIANLHTPTQFQGQTEAVIKSLNLYKQTSWVFCNGRHDIDSTNKELDYRDWLRKTCRDVEQLVSFICNPDVFSNGRCLIIFLLLSPVDSEKDPVFDTYTSFIKHTEETNIISVCESKSTYLKWKQLIQEKCDFDIDHLSISELSLSEINGTIMGLGPQNQSAGRLLPSSGSSTVVMKQKEEDLLTALDILCLNECENIYDENSSEFEKFRVEVEEEFYRGGKVRWWNFYFCGKDKEKPFIKRDKYENVKTMIRSQRESNETCVLLNLFHAPGCGGTTLAMNVMWDLRHEFRCAVLKDKTLPKTEIANQVRHLMELESEKLSPVLLFVDDSKETENLNDLVTGIRRTIEDFSNVNADAQNCKVIILNCVRSQSPQDLYKRHSQTQNQYLTANLTPQEQMDFKKKLKDLKETHEKPENFYSFMVMKSNFDKKYTEDLARETLENFDFSSKEGRLFAFLALLNTYVAKSEISLSLCEDFFQMKMIHWSDNSVLDKMKPLSNLLIVDRVEEWGGYKGIRILHHEIASACLDELERSYSLKVSDIVMEMLHYDLFFSAGVVKCRLMLSIHRMLIERQRKKDERELFSPLIDKVHNQEGRQTVQKIFVKASSRYETSASIPQALARYLYINVRDFPEALKWAEKAKNVKENVYTFDTIGQVHKSNLRSNIEREKQETSHNPEHLNKNIEIAKNGMKAFQRAQDLADPVDEPQEETPDEDSEDYPRRSYNFYGLVSMLEIAFLVFEILGRLPFFEKDNPMKKRNLQSFLGGTIPITSVYREDGVINNRYFEIIKEHEQFLVKLKSDVKQLFDFLDCYFAYIKGNSEFDMMNHRTVSENFKKYVELFCTPEEKRKEQRNKSTLNLKIDIEERKLFLERNQADTFSGILQHLDKPAKEMEHIAECYAFLQKNTVNQKQRTQINYILSNIVLHHLNPKSKHVKKYKDLCALLKEILQDLGLQHPFPDPYYLALLLFWPSPTEESTDFSKYVTAIRNSSRKNLSKLFQKRSTVAFFYLGKETELKRLVSKPSLDKSFLPKMSRDTIAQLWRTGDIFKEEAIFRRLHRVSGTIEQGEVYANYGTQKILVRPARIAGIRSGFSNEKVSFYIGFAINGPLAYDITYEN